MDSPEQPEDRLARWRRLAPFLALAWFVVGILLLHRELDGLRWTEIRDHLRQVPLISVLGALVAAFAGLGVLALGDTQGARAVHPELSWARSLFSSFIARAIGRVFGQGWLSGSGARMRMYAAWGVDAEATARLLVTNALTFWIGPVAINGVVLVLAPPEQLGALGRPLGIALLALLLAAGLGGALRREPLRLRGYELHLPQPGTVLLNAVCGIGEHALSALGLYLFLPDEARIGFPQFLSLFVVAATAASLTGIPGGAGAFEGLLVVLLRGHVAPTTALGSLLLWRLTDDLAPLAAAGLTWAIWEARRARQKIAGFGRTFAAASGWMAAPVMGGLFAATGAVLLLSAVTPALPERLKVLDDWIPLGVLEASHLGTALAGISLILVARAVWNRLREGWTAAVALCAFGVPTSLLKGLDWEEASLLGLVLVLALLARRRFYRKARLGARLATPETVALVAAGLALMVGLLLQVAPRVSNHLELWSQVELHQNAARGLRSALAVSGVVGVAAVGMLLRPAPHRPERPGERDLADIARILSTHPSTNPWLALVGDKAVLFNEARTAFVSFGVKGRTWVVYSDPAGPREEWSELLWRLRELADAHTARLAFYEVGAGTLPLLLDLGLTAFKFGEEAVVDIRHYTLEGGAQKSRRQLLRKLEAVDARFEIVRATEVEPLLDELARVSEAWLGGKTGREKGFSLGFFDRDYLRRTDVAIVRHEGRVVAFANLLRGSEELSIDLMRFVPGVLDGLMEYLFVRLMLWGREQGLQRFNLGMAPLAGMPSHALAPVWAQMANLVFRQGEEVYNFQGLRQFKEKFRPTWEPRYLAVPGGMSLPIVLTAIAALVGGGLVGTVRK